MVNEISMTITTKHTNNDAMHDITNNLKQCDNSQTIEEVTLTNKVELTCSYDMGWSKRAGGRIYDSASGHGYLVGVESGKIVGWGVKKKKCSQCETI